MTSYRTRSTGRYQVLQYKFIETKRPILFFLKDRKKETWLDVPKPFIDTAAGFDNMQVLHGTVNSNNTDLAAFQHEWPNVHDYLREVYGPMQHLLMEEQRRFHKALQEKKEFKYKY